MVHAMKAGVEVVRQAVIAAAPANTSAAPLRMPSTRSGAGSGGAPSPALVASFHWDEQSLLVGCILGFLCALAGVSVYAHVLHEHIP